jgi:CcmD family protein
MKKFILFLFMIISLTAQAQQVEMADKFREDGKIYVVVAVVLIILIGLLTYVFLLDRKISKLEKEVQSEKQA